MFTTVFLEFALTIFRHYNGFSLSFPLIFICQHGIATNYYFHSRLEENYNLIVLLKLFLSFIYLLRLLIYIFNKFINYDQIC